MPGGSVVTVEPGGAVELSGPPARRRGARDRGDDHRPGRAAKSFRRRRSGTGIAGRGSAAAGQAHQSGRALPRDGRVLQGQSLRRCGRGDDDVDGVGSGQSRRRAREPDGRTRVRLAHALGPTLVAIAANSPLLGGQFSGWRSTRQRVWSQLDSARCGPILTASGEDPGTDWARYALKAPVMLVHSPEAVPVHALPALRGLGRWPRTARRSSADPLRPGIPPDHAVSAGASTAVAGNPLPGQRSRCHLAGRGVHAGDSARRPGCRRYRGRSRRTRRHRLGHRGPGRAERPAAPRRGQPVRGRRRRPRAGLGSATAMQRLVEAVEQGRCPADEFSDRGDRATASRPRSPRWR